MYNERETEWLRIRSGARNSVLQKSPLFSAALWSQQLAYPALPLNEYLLHRAYLVKYWLNSLHGHAVQIPQAFASHIELGGLYLSHLSSSHLRHLQSL